MILKNALSVHVFLNTEAEKQFHYEGGNGWRLSAPYLGRILVTQLSKMDNRFSFFMWTKGTLMPEVLIGLVDEIVWSNELACDPPLPTGVHKYKNGQLTISDKSAGRCTITISAKDFQSLIEIYVKIYPEKVLPEFVAEPA